MELGQFITLVALVIIIAEVSYLVYKLPRQLGGKRQKRLILLDTSVLIDGRILAVASSGFVGGVLVIPRSVVGELQFLADNADHDKRTRARFGLDCIKELQTMPSVEVEILQDGSKAEEGVDERLLKLAKKHGAAICTIDYNLAKVAIVETIQVLNVNDLAKNLRMAYLPGERIMLELAQKGQDSHQAVGYLPDGTMVVVEQASRFIGQAVEVEFIRTLQTAAGKMMFAKRVETQNVAYVQATSHSSVRQSKSRGSETQGAAQQPRRSPHGRNPKRSPKPTRGNDRESSLIDLIEKQ